MNEKVRVLPQRYPLAISRLLAGGRVAARLTNCLSCCLVAAAPFPIGEIAEVNVNTICDFPIGKEE